MQRRLRERTGLVRLGVRARDEAFEAIRRSVPRTVDAVRLFDLVEQRLGDRAARDFWVFPNERALILRDPARPGWWLPHRFVYLDVDRQVQPEPPGPFGDWPPLPEPVEQSLLPLTVPAPPARLRIDLAGSYFEALFDHRGAIHQTVSSTGDLFGVGRSDEPFVYDPFGKPPQPPPLPLLTRDDLDPSGHPVDELAEWVTALRPDEADRGRVWVPVPTPGGVTGAWTRGLWNLRLAAWDGQLDARPGWAVADAFNGAAVAAGPTFDDAVGAWRALVARVQPLPPVEREVGLPEGPHPEPTEPTSTYDAETGVSMSEMTFVWVPPVKMTWPEPRPENVPAAAIPLDPAPEVPDALASRGYGRVVRLFGEHGDTGFVFVRDEPDGYTVIGDSAAAAIEPRTLDDELDELDRLQQAEYLTMPMFADREPWNDPSYPVHIANYQAWDATGRFPELRRVGGAWAEAFQVHPWDVGMRHLIQRIRFRAGSPAVRRPV
ncbi:MAG: hypothetical protein ABMB14_18555 [Myxococcota bacterium]